MSFHDGYRSSSSFQISSSMMRSVNDEDVGRKAWGRIATWVQSIEAYLSISVGS